MACQPVLAPLQTSYLQIYGTAAHRVGPFNNDTEEHGKEDPSGPDPANIIPSRVHPCVRDVSWHSEVGQITSDEPYSAR